MIQNLLSALALLSCFLDAFIAENPDGLSLDDLAIVGAFRHAVPGKFYVERVLKAHAVFVSTKTKGPDSICAAARRTCGT